MMEEIDDNINGWSESIIDYIFELEDCKFEE